MAKSTTSITPKGEGDVADFLEKIRGLSPVAKDGERGKLIFAMDATMSRQPSWDRALSIQAEMFAETARIGGLDVQLVYFRGFNECRASKWVSNPTALAKLMTTVDCRGGNTQIGRALSHVKKEMRTTKVNAVIYVGDAMEENIDVLCQAAGEIGLQGTPIFAFQEGNDGNAERGPFRKWPSSAAAPISNSMNHRPTCCVNFFRQSPSMPQAAEPHWKTMQRPRAEIPLCCCGS